MKTCSWFLILSRGPCIPGAYIFSVCFDLKLIFLYSECFEVYTIETVLVVFKYSVVMNVDQGERRTAESCLPSVQASEVKWASRWDTYLTMSDVQIHWFSIVNSVVVVFFLSGMILF